MRRSVKLGLSSLVIAILTSTAGASKVQWTPTAAGDWSAHQGWVVGANFIPKSAVNQIEMWQAPTFDPNEIERELAVAQSTGFSSVRVFLHDLVWQQDPRGFASRIDQFLTIAERHQIKPVLVLFDSCWNPAPHLGAQSDPIPGVHNSGWVQSPGLSALMDDGQLPRLRDYVQGVVGRFANDQRILAWDVWNEPDNLNGGSYFDPQSKLGRVAQLLPQVFEWVRSADPVQPLTSGVWAGDWSDDSRLTPIQKTQLSLSDIISFHSYDPPDFFATRISSLQRFGRPMFCTEYMARPLGSLVQTILPLAKKNNVGSFNWGFVAGRTQTYFPWDSWQHAYPQRPPVWFHDLFQFDLKPYDPAEIQFLQAITAH